MKYPKLTPWERVPRRWQKGAIAALERTASEAEREIAYYERTYPCRGDRPLPYMSQTRCTARACRAAAEKLKSEL